VNPPRIVHPSDTPAQVQDVVLALLPRDVQESGHTTITHSTIGSAVASGTVANETLGYFLARIQLFLLKIGVNPARLRFRQHMANEMAHYATDCWDAEIHNSAGWTECVGCADRAAYDLSVHANKTGAPLGATEALREPRVYEELQVEVNKKTFGKTFGREQGVVDALLKDMGQEELAGAQKALENGPVKLTAKDGKTFEITKDHVSIVLRTVKQTTRTYIPNVIEPSFGLGRILYCLLEHSYWARAEDVNRGVLSLPPLVAPTKCLVVPLSSHDSFKPIVSDVSAKLRRAGVLARVDDSSASIGKRYARNDELGTPFGITIDFASLQNGTMTLRERDTTAQRIGPIDEVIDVVRALVDGTLDWAGACERLPAYDGVQAVE